MQFRHAVESDLDRVLSYGSGDPLAWPGIDMHQKGVADGSWSLDKTWLAVDGESILAMARFWAPPGHDEYVSLDGLYVDDAVVDRAGLAARLLEHVRAVAGTTPAYHMFVPGNWRDDAAAFDAVSWRRDALAKVGMTRELERLRYRWVPDAGVADPDPRVEFRPADDAAFLAAFCEVSEGTLDVSTQQGVAVNGVEAEAREHMGVYLEMPGDRDWWRLAYDTDGELVGLAIPSANNGGPVVGYIGVVPKHRGRGYVDPLLAEITRCLAATGAQRIGADTDMVNIPMARAFDRAGYVNYANRLVIDAPE